MKGYWHLKELNRLLEIIADIAAGRYSNDVMELTVSRVAEPVRTIAEAMGLMMVKVEAREYRLEMLVKELEEMNQQVRRSTIETVSSMAKALAARDSYTQGHAERVGQIAGLIAAEMRLTEEETDLVELAGLLHDIGKIGFPDYLFLPHEGDNPKEIIREITRHPITGAEILKDLDFLGEALSYIRYHHERPDGRGYPEGLKSADIPLGAKIIAVADGFDAITTDRPYQKGQTYEEALSILKRGAGTKWDEECVNAFERTLPKIPLHEDAAASLQESLQCLSTFDYPEITLQPGPPGGAGMRWLKPDVDFSKYHRLILAPVVFFFAPDSEYKGIDPQELKGLADVFRRRLVDTLKKEYPITETPAPDVARLSFAITDLKQSRPDVCGITADGLIGFGEKSRQGRDGHLWSKTGATEAELVVFDSLTQEVIAASKDRRTIGLKEKFTKWGSAEDAFQFWAERIKLFMDKVHGRIA
jgi:putative nucleotidyltransferase with HDIG domain